MSEEISPLTATDLLKLYRSKALSPIEATRAVLDRIERHNGPLNAFRFVAADEAIAAARESEARWLRGEPKGLVDGVPTTVKDQWLTKGWSTLRGSRVVSPEGPWKEDTPVVARLREHGAVFLGKTTMCEFGWKGVTDSPLTGVSRNPWNPQKTCGGSSGGAAIAAAAGMGMLNVGSDGAGSIRMPSAFCGVFGMKSTFGRVPTYPYNILPAFSHTGPMVRTVPDAALMLTVLTEPDHRDWLGLPPERRDYRIGLDAGVRGLRIAYSRTLGYAEVDPEIARLVDDAVAVLGELGAVVELKDPGFAEPRAAFETYYSASQAVAVEPYDEAQRGMMDSGLLAMAERGKSVSGGELLKAWAARAELGRHMNAFHRTYDLLITPQLPLAAFDAGRDFPEGRGMTSWFDWNPFCYPFNFTQQPAASVPVGLTSEGLPAAMQIVGARYAEPVVLQASRAYESARPFQLPQLRGAQQ